MSAAHARLLARAASWFLAPAPAVDARHAPVAAPAIAPSAAVPRPVVAVCGVRTGCGTTTIARALAAELASRDPLRSAVVCGPDVRGTVPLGTSAAARLTRLVTERSGLEARPSGRLCVARGEDPAAVERVLRDAASVVLDVGDLRLAPAAASLADRVVLVATPGTEPPLAEIVATSLARVGPAPLIALNRSAARPDGSAALPAPAAWAGRAHVVVPLAPTAARLALACRGAGGSFGAAIALLADSCLEP